METNRRSFLKMAAMGSIGMATGSTGGAYWHGDRQLDFYDRIAPRAQPHDLPFANGIVVFTGSSGRIEEAFRICGAYQRLHISGCAEGYTPDTILSAFRIRDSKAKRENITVDHARSTAENGRFTREWLEAHPDISRLVIVTSDFHVPRAYSLLRNELRSINREIGLLVHEVSSPVKWDVKVKERFKMVGDNMRFRLATGGEQPDTPRF